MRCIIMMCNYQLKMLVLLVLVINTLHICKGKALLEEIESNRGKRSYAYLPNTGLHQTYDPQSNAEYWMKGGFYQPEVDGQPIYVPAVDQPGSYQEFLDAYYKAYTPAWNVENSDPYVHATKSASDIKGSSEYALPISKEFSVDMSSSDSEAEDYGDPEVVDSVSVTLFSNGNPENPDEPESLEEPLKKPNIPKTKPTDDQYIPPVTKVVKQKTKDKNLNKLSTPKSVYVSTETVKDVKQKPKVDYSKKESPKQSTSKNTNKPNKKTVVKNPNKYGVKYESPLPKEKESLLEMSKFIDGLETDGTIVTEFNEENLDETPEIGEDEFEEPVIRESLKSEFNKPKDDQYEMPVVKSVKQKPKVTNAEKKWQKKPSTPVNNYKTSKNTKVKDSAETSAVYKPQLSKEKEFSVEMNMAEDYELDSEDYDNPEVVETKTEKQVEPSELADRLEEADLNKLESELSKTKSQDNNQYDMPVVIKKRKKTANKKRTTKQKTKPQLQSGYVKPTRKRVKAKPAEKASTQKYGVQTTQGTIKLPKGKRRKQYSKPYSRTGEIAKEISNAATEMNKKDVQPYPPEDSQNKPRSNLEYLPVEIKQKATVKSNSDDKPVKEIKYDTELGRDQLTNSDENKLDGVNTRDPEEEPNLSLDMSESELSENLDSESKITETKEISEGLNRNIVLKPESTVSHADDFRGLSSMNSNIWSMLFNPNAEQNKLKLKRCITRSNETGFCTYIQNCEVPHIATSLEQLLNNACVIDDIFIGVCCPEFPVQTVKVHWDQTPSDIDNHVEDEFGHITEGELIKSWCDGYEDSLTNLLISFSLADCGIRSNEASELQSWPWKAPLVSMSNGKIFCGGVVVSEDHILTAAHCTTKIPKNQILVRLGQYDDESGDDYAVIEIKRHAQYNPRTMQNDVALLKLGRRIMNDAHIGIVCLPDEDKDNHDGEIATLLGWRGIFGTKSRDPEFLRVISNKECENKLGMKVPSTSLCTETRKESGRTCNADSGAPLVIEDDGKYEVIGILSWNRNDCDQRFPSTFSRVSSYAGWIKNHIG